MSVLLGAAYAGNQNSIFFRNEGNPLDLGQVSHLQVVSEGKFRNVQVDLIGKVAGTATYLDLVGNHLEDSSLRPDPLGLSNQNERNLGLEIFPAGHLDEIDMKDGILDRIGLHFLDQDEFILSLFPEKTEQGSRPLGLPKENSAFPDHRWRKTC